MKIEDFKDLGPVFNCTFNLQDNAPSDWKRIYVLTPRGVTIGRLSFLHGELKYVKCYKRDFHDTVDVTDEIFMRLNRYLQDGVVITMPEFGDLEERAKAIREEELKEQMDWRAAHPLFGKDGNPKRRKSLKGRNVRHILNRLIMTY